MSDPVKFRLYTRLTLQVSVVVAAVSLAIAGDTPSATAGIVVSALAATIAVEAQPVLTTWSNAGFRRWAIPAAGATLIAVWAVAAIVANVATAGSVVDGADVAGSGAATLGVFTVVPFMRHRWRILLGISLASGLVFGAPDGTQAQSAAVMLLVGAFFVGTTLLTLWGLRIVDDLEAAKNVGAELHLAEERLRFARDLHDVVGRGFSAIAVKSELAATLLRSGAADRAEAEITEVKALAVESMKEMRQLVRGYRDIDLAGEVAGARSLLSATGCTLVVEGELDKVPARLHEVAAWVVREGTTNVVKHSSATSATLAFGTTGMSLRNDGATGPTKERSGLHGLAERLAAHGAGLATATSDGEFVLDIRWEAT